MGMPLDEDFNDIPTVTVQPKLAKGGVFATADISLIKEALHCFIQTKGDELPRSEEHTSELQSH